MSAESNSEKSVSYQKKDGRGHARPSFFWYDNDKDLKVYFLVKRVICPSLGDNISEQRKPSQPLSLQMHTSETFTLAEKFFELFLFTGLYVLLSAALI